MASFKVLLLCLVLLPAVSVAQSQSTASTDNDYQNILNQLQENNRKLLDLQTQFESERQIRYRAVNALSRQLNLQQLYIEEQARTDGDSGIKATRLMRSGSRSYQADSYTSINAVLAIHDHSNYRDTVGLGELAAVLNGVDFKTRHNDYRLLQPHRTNRIFRATEAIKMPGIPPEVLSKNTTAEQVKEMQQWFAAFQKQDPNIRDYRKYFKPILCYLEGMWSLTDLSGIGDLFNSDRHSLDAESFYQLQDNIRFSAYTGRKNSKENFAFLPTIIANMTENGMPQMAMWNYDILCHPLKDDLPTNRFRLVDDLHARVARGRAHLPVQDRPARFQLWHNGPDPKEGWQKYTSDGYDLENVGTILDKIMSEIPGKDNYQGYVVDNAWNETAYKHSSKVSASTEAKYKPLNAGYYHRRMKSVAKDAMGSSTQRRGFNDANLYVALNTQEKILSSKTKRCTRRKCQEWEQRVSYAIPLEIIYLTPLLTWNPYNLTYHSRLNVPEHLDKKNDIKRTGEFKSHTAYNGLSQKLYYATPAEFYKAGGLYGTSSADTSKKIVGVLDQNGDIKKTAASGVYITTPEITGVGQVRLRYPIPAMHASGSSTQKELDALRDVTLNPTKYNKFYPGIHKNGTTIGVFRFVTAWSKTAAVGAHDHVVYLNEEQLRALKYEKARITVTTEETLGHRHTLTLDYGINPRNNVFYVGVRSCDGKHGKKCPDGHTGGVLCMDCMMNGYDFPV